MSSNSTELRIEQSLHGYADGHRLLQSSRKFPTETSKAMLFMTDMSGPSMTAGFESYLTGYSLDEIGAYAVGRTWYAPEMDRPGCVWTHTLLFEKSDIASIADLRNVLKLFSRPQKEPSSWLSYGSTMHLDKFEALETADSRQANARVKSEIVPSVLLALYGESAKQPVYIPSEDASTFEELVILIWNQQWPALRTSFFFSTGSIANRKTSRRHFDLQVISWRSLNQVTREVPSSVVVRADITINPVVQPTWLRIAADDLLFRPTALRRFLQNYGMEAAEPRIDFVPLAKMFAATQNGETSCTLNDLVKMLAESFPKVDDARKLKESILGPTAERSRNLTEASEHAILWELVSTPFQSSFDSKQMNIRERAKALLLSSPAEAREITIDIVEREITPFGDAFLSGISEAIDFDDAYEFARSKPELLNVFTKYNPQLAAMPALWRSSAEEQREFFDIVVANLDSAESNSNMIVAMLDAQSDVLAQEIVDRYKQLAVDSVLKWIDGHLECLDKLGREWLWALRSTPVLLLDWLRRHLEANEQTAAFISGLLDPHSEAVIAVGSEVWSSLKKKPYSSLTYDTHIRAMAFLLALGFNNPPLGAAELVATSFESVHDAAADQSLPQSSWRMLKDQAPDYSLWWSWDKCKRLRCALIERFIRFHWHRQQFLESAHGKTFERILSNSHDVEGGQDFIREVASQALSGNIQADSGQIRDLKYSI
jgi:hypothetical protein